MLVPCALALIFALTHAENRESRVVNTSQGLIRGYKEDGLFAFYGIPYATAPTGVHKFKPPGPPPTWQETFEAVDKSIICPQGSFYTPGFSQSKSQEENCLIANVFVPDREVTNSPVLVSVHGGGYQLGNGLMLTPKALVNSKKIIVVTFNYRLGVHGFLCLGTKDIPGNAGMKDQVALLRWVKQNIRSFGGNPKDVTITGHSAGASAVELIQLSKSAKGLFHKIIPESGASIGAWSIQSDPLYTAREFAKQLKFENVDDVFALEEFYKNATLDLLSSEVSFDRIDAPPSFSPCVERNIGEEIFLDDSPLNILKNGDYTKYPMLCGYSNMEGMFRLMKTSMQDWIKRMNEKFADVLPVDLQFKSNEEKEKVAQKIKEYYFRGQKIGLENLERFVAYFTDITIAYPTLKSIKLQIEAGNKNIYLYEYSFVADEKLPYQEAYKNVTFKGADHCAQTYALYEAPSLGIHDESRYSERTKKMRAVMRELWLNFITTGAPVPNESSSFPKWLPVEKDWGPHMSLDEFLELKGPLSEKTARFWDDIYEKHYRNPIPPPAPSRVHSDL